MCIEIIALVISCLALLVTIVGWRIEHHLSAKRDLENKKREIRIQFFADAWRKVAKANTNGDDQALSDAFFDIQLFGTPEEIKQIKQVVKDRMKNKYTGKELTLDLRNSLRTELGLVTTDEEVWGLKVVKKGETKTYTLEEFFDSLTPKEDK